MDKRSFVFYNSYKEQIGLLEDAEKGRLLMAIINYSSDNIVPAMEEELGPAAYMAFAFIKNQMDMDAAKYAKKSETLSKNGSLGGKAKASRDKQTVANASKPKQIVAKPSLNVDVDDDVDDDDNVDGVIPPTPHKAVYGEFGNVKLDDTEMERLVQQMGKDGALLYIDRLDVWLAEGNTKKNHYATMLNWWRKDGKPVTIAKPPPTYDLEELDKLNVFNILEEEHDSKNI